MAEELNPTIQEASENQVDYMEGWDTGGIDYSESQTEETTPEADQQAEGEESEGGEEENAEEAETAENTGNQTGEEPAENDTLTIRYMGKDETISRAEAVILAQKGRNYDNIHQRMVEAEAYKAENEDAIAFLQRMAALEAKAAGKESMSISEYVDACQIRVMVSQGMSEEQAQRELNLQKREAQVAKQESQSAQQKQPQPEETEKDRVAKDKAAFQSVFRDVDMKDIPMEVWEDLSKHPDSGLIAAYAKYQASRAEAAEAEARKAQDALRQQEDARRRSPGSMRNTNPKPQKSKEDEVYAGWTF